LIQPGEVWAAGDHVVACGDLRTGAVAWLIQEFGPVHLIYVDPPWSGSVISVFSRQAGVERTESFDEFLVQVARAPLNFRGPAFFEMGKAKAHTLLAALVDQGGVLTHEWTITYDRDRPCRLMRVTFGPGRPFDCDLTGLDDADTPRIVIEGQTDPGQVVLDYCAGRGCTAIAAVLTGRRSVNMELCPDRAQAALVALEKKGLPLCKIGRNAKIHPRRA